MSSEGQGDDRKRDFRQLWDGKRSVEVELMDPPALARYGRLCGSTLARAHARSVSAADLALLR